MKRTSRPLTAVLGALALGVAVGVLPARAGDLTLERSGPPTAWTFRYAGQTVMIYAFASQKFKPYVQELAPLGGVNLLRDAPHDHLHHHALMYAVAVNGLNFWEETSGNGVEKPVASPPPELGTGADGLPQATIRQTLHWLAPADAFLPDSPKNALLIEQRTLVLTVNEAKQEVALRWKSAFELGGKTNAVTLTGPTYFGLGMRFREDLDALAEQFNADGRPDLSGTKQDVSPHAWSAVAFDAPGAPETIALFDHPANVRSPAAYFTMKRPFAYLAATQGLSREPLVYHAGDKFELNYLVTVYPAIKGRDFLDGRGKSWQQSKP